MKLTERYKREDADKFLAHLRTKPQTRMGWYVEGRFYGANQEQAIARADHLTALYGRKVDVVLVMPSAPSIPAAHPGAERALHAS